MTKATQLKKAFGDAQAVAGVDFDVGDGELFGFLGPNVAGKTTTINMLTGLARPAPWRLHLGFIVCSADSGRGHHRNGTFLA